MPEGLSPKPYEWTGGAASDFDTGAAASCLGKTILISVTYVDAQGQAENGVEMHGVVESAAPDGIRVSLRGARDGQSWTMPPDLSAISTADAGRYGIRETGEIIENPELIAIWTVATPPKSKPAG
jgi:hypothetical protein